MASYTAAEIKVLTSIPKVNSWGDTKIDKYVSIAEGIIDSLEMDESIDGYSTAYSNAVLLMFDAIAENPTGRIKSSAGKTSVEFAKELPQSIQNIIGPYIVGSDGGFLSSAEFERNDIGIR